MVRSNLSELVRSYSAPYLVEIGLPYLPNHLMTLIRAFLLWWSLQFLSAGVSPILFPKQLNAMSPRKRVIWDMHVVAFFHSAIIAPAALYVWLNVDPKKTDMVFGYDYNVGQLYAISLAYFLWDIIQSARYESLQFVVHGLIAAIASLLTYHPFLMFDGLGILIWEASTPFLNIHWFMDKLGMTGSFAQLVNAFFLLATYVCMRLILGVYNSYSLVSSLWQPTERQVGHVYLGWKLFYTIGLIVLNILNYFWFSKMVRAIQKRFTKNEKKA